MTDGLEYIRDDDGKLLVVAGDMHAILAPGSLFFGQPEDMIQWGVFNHPVGTKLANHIHKMRTRPPDACKTIEFFYVVKGLVRADIFDNYRKPVRVLTLTGEMFLMMYDGGHGFEILTPDTQMIEVKLGPFVSVEADKEKW